MSSTKTVVAEDRKIVGFSVVKPEETKAPEPQKEVMGEDTPRPEALRGTTYKVKPPSHVADAALYVTINDIVLNPGTPDEEIRPCEIFINSKEMKNFQWVAALTLVISAVFRKGGSVAFLAEELKAVMDPSGGYWKPGGKFMPSLVAEIGTVIETHLQMLGMIEKPELDEHQKALIAAKRKEFEAKEVNTPEAEESFPANATLCTKCSTKAVVKLDGCLTCLSCGDSKCG